MVSHYPRYRHLFCKCIIDCYTVIVGNQTMSKEIHKETATTVFTGLIINYPLQVLLLYIMLDILKWEDSFTIATTGVAFMTVVAYTRVFIIRKYFKEKYEKRKIR